jgi:hypothetical protein
MATGCVATRPRPSGVGAASTEAPGAASTPASPTYSCSNDGAAARLLPGDAAALAGSAPRCDGEERRCCGRAPHAAVGRPHAATTCSTLSPIPDKRLMPAHWLLAAHMWVVKSGLQARSGYER